MLSGQGTVVSVLIVNWRRPELTLASARSVLGQHSDFEIELVVVDNETTPASVQTLRAALPDARIVPVRENSGFAGGVTAGMAAARGSVIVLLNNDAEAQEGFLQAGVTRLLDGPASVAAVAARVDLAGRFAPRPDGAPRCAADLVGADGRRWAAEAGPSGVGLVNSTGVSVTPVVNGYDRDWLAASDGLRRTAADDPFGFTGAAVFLRRSAIESVGGFDTDYFMYYEDLDISWRLRLSGYGIVFEPRAVVSHRHAGSSDHDSPLIRVNGIRNRWLTTLKNGSARLVLAVTARTAARWAKDVVSTVTRRGRPFIAAADWWRIARTSLRLAPRMLARRRAAKTPAAARRVLERRFFGRG